MADSIVRLPIDYFPDPSKGRPVFNGQVFIGNPDTDPEILGNRKPVTLRQEDGTEVPVTGPGQPLITGSGGVVLYNGSPVQVLTEGNYSIKVLNSKGSQVYYVESVLDSAPLTGDEAMLKLDVLNDAVISVTLAEGNAINIAGRLVKNDGGGAVWDVVLTADVTVNGFDIVQSTGDALLSLELRTTPVMTGIEFGMVSDFIKSPLSGTSNDGPFDRMMIRASADGIEFSIPNGSYLYTVQQTIRHNLAVKFNGSVVGLNHTGSKNDSPFQMGNNSTLIGISELLYKSTSVSAFTTLGMVKIGEFYAKIGGAPNAGDNSLDDTYWEVSGVTVKDVHGSSSLMTLNTDRNFTSTVFAIVNDNVETDNISLDGLAADGIPVAAQSAVRTETGYDINLRRQGFNLIVNNTTGTNLRAHPENAVVYINGDRNTKVTNVHGQDCGQIFAVNSNGNAANQDPSLRGKNGVNILAENITGFDCKIETGDTFSKKVAAVNIKFEEPDLVTGNRSQIKVSGIHLESTQVAGDKLDKGISINDSATTAIDTKRIIVENFECGYFPEGLLTDTSTEQSLIQNGWIHHSDSNGATLRGIDSTYNRLKITLSNQSGLVDANGFNGHGIGLQTKGAQFNECIIGDETVASGSETHLSAVQVSANDTRAAFNNCRIGNYQTGFNDFNLRGGITGSDVFIDERTKGQMRNVTGTSFPIDVGTGKVSASVNGTNGALFQGYRCATARTGTGTYTVTFDKSFADANYRVTGMTAGSAVSNRKLTFAAKTTAGFTVYTYNDAQVLTDVDFDIVVFGNYHSQV